MYFKQKKFFYRNDSPLLCAIQNNHIEIVKELIHCQKHKIDVNLDGIFKKYYYSNPVFKFYCV